MVGLKRGMVELMPHQDEWNENAQHIIQVLKQLLGNTAMEIQHIGSTAVAAIHAKPIIDLAVGVCDLSDILPHIELLKQHGFLFCGEDVPGQLLFVMDSSEGEIRTHHIHIVKWHGTAWNNYINFRDYLNAYPEKAIAYDMWKQELALRFYNDRKNYTAGKQEIIVRLLNEAKMWRTSD